MATNPSTEFFVGELFTSFDALEAKIKAVEESNFIQLWKRDARTIAAALKKGVKRSIKGELKFYSLKYCLLLSWWEEIFQRQHR